LQAYAYLELYNSGGNSTRALFSLVVSAATSGFAAASVSYVLGLSSGPVYT
jgi:hypothetical protein